jgi:hypothetical protein
MLTNEESIAWSHDLAYVGQNLNTIIVRPAVSDDRRIQLSYLKAERGETTHTTNRN